MIKSDVDIFLCLCLTEENTSLLFHPPPPALAVGLLSFPLISLHNLLGTVPQSISSCMENAIFFICFMQITPSNTQSIGEGDKKKKNLATFFSHMRVGFLHSAHSSLFLVSAYRG